MGRRDFVEENETARRELSEFVAQADEQAFNSPAGGWTVASSLCHLAFWDQRALYLLRQWESGGEIEAARLSTDSVESINQAVNVIAQAVPGPAAAKLALDSALAVDSYLAGISDEMVDRLMAVGFERYLRRSLHRREHLRKMREAVGRT